MATLSCAITKYLFTMVIIVVGQIFSFWLTSEGLYIGNLSFPMAGEGASSYSKTPLKPYARPTKKALWEYLMGQNRKNYFVQLGYKNG